MKLPFVDRRQRRLESENALKNQLLNAQGASPPHDAIAAVQSLLAANGYTVPKTGTLDKATHDALEAFQKDNVDAQGYPLASSGQLDDPTLDSLLHARARMVTAIGNFGLVLSVCGLFYVWNQGYWSEDRAALRETIRFGVISLLAVLFGVRSVSALLVPAAAGRIRASWYRAQTRPSLTVFLLVLAACATTLLFAAPKEVRAVVVPRDKQLIRIALVRNGTAPYTREVMTGFIQHLDELLQPTRYSPAYDEEIGVAEQTNRGGNDQIFDNLVGRFPNKRPDYLVTIGTQVSVFAKQKYLNSIPIIFSAVTDPVRSKIVPSLQPDRNRGNIAGVTYGIPTSRRLQFIADAFGDRKIGFLWNPEYEQDVVMRDQVAGQASQTQPPLNIEFIEIRSPSLSQQDLARADVFFGWYYLNTTFHVAAANIPKPLIGATVADAQRGAIACISNDDRALGAVTADVLYQNLSGGVALPDLSISSPNLATIAINLGVARRFGLTISDRARQKATILFDY